MGDSMYGLLKYQSKGRLKEPALYFVGKKITYAALFDEIDKAAVYLFNSGVGKGDTVTVALPNIPTAVAVLYAANKLGAVVNFVHPLVPVKKLLAYAEKTDSNIIFVLDKIANAYADKLAASGKTIIVCNASPYLGGAARFFYNTFTFSDRSKLKRKDGFVYYSDVLKSRHIDIKSSHDEDLPAAVMHSGGTTSEPKSIVLSNKSFNAVAINTVRVIDGYSPDGGMLAALPMFHAFGVGVCIHTALVAGYCVYLVPKFSTKKIVKMLNRLKIAVLAGVPAMYEGMLGEKKFDSPKRKRLSFAFCGGDALSLDTKEKFDGIMKKHGSACVLDEGYGLTEMCGVFSVNTRAFSRAGSLGKPLGDYGAEVFEGAKMLGRGEEGEICLCGDSMMNGYLGDEAATSYSVFEYNGKNYLRTGDYGTVDADGFIFYKQRLKRVVKINGVSVFPSEAERAIASLPFVSECAVIENRDERNRTYLKALVVLKPGIGEREASERIGERCAENLNKWTAPRSVVFVDRLPKTYVGKVDYGKLKSGQ